jgi:hypothetical protein
MIEKHSGNQSMSLGLQIIFYDENSTPFSNKTRHRYLFRNYLRKDESSSPFEEEASSPPWIG